MHAPLISRTAAEVLVDQLVIHGVEHVFCVPGESYLAVLDALHDRAIQVTVCRQECGAAMMAEAVGKATGEAGCLLRHAWAGRHQRDARPSCRAAGFHADDPVRRPGRAWHARARGVPGNRLSRGLRADHEMDRRDRRSRACPRACLARVSCGDKRAAGTGGARLAGGHADRTRRRERRTSACHDRDGAGRGRYGAAANDAGSGGAPAADPRRKPVEHRRLRRYPRLRRDLRDSRPDELSPPAALRCDAFKLCGRSRDRDRTRS